MIFFDTETTGLIKNAALPINQQPRIIEIGAVKDTGKGKAKYFSCLIDPQIKIDSIITRITGITQEELVGQPKFRDVIDEFIEFCFGESTWVAHNMDFDMQMLIFELRRCGREYKFPYPPHQIDTVQLARPLYNGKFKKLEDIYEDFFGATMQAHRALDDAQMLQKVYHELMVRS